MNGTIKESKVDVLVIGAGPAGLMAANALSQADVDFRVVDLRPSKVAAGQADGIQPRTIEVFQSYGLADRLLREGNQMHTAAFYNPGPNGGIIRSSRAPDVTASNARFPFEVTLHQGAIESIFLDSMQTKGHEVHRPVRPTALEISEDEEALKDPHAYVVKVTLENLDPEAEVKTEIVHAKYVIGADGAHSWVRKTLGLSMDGEQTDYIWGVVDMVPETDFPDIRCKCAIHSSNGSCMIIPREGDLVRLYLQLDDKEVLTNGRVDRSKTGPEKLLAVAKKSLYPFEITFPTDLDWWTIYIIGQRVASKYSVKERVFISGDACHTHSPKAGQGMNASMNDTHNLVWKLSHVLRGWANPSILETYEFERRKYAQDLINFDKKFAALFSGKPKSEINIDGVSHEEFLEAFQTFGGFTSGIGIHYADSPVVTTLPSSSSIAANLIPGTRMPPQIILRAADNRPYDIQDLLPSDTRFKVVLFVGDVSGDRQQKDKVQKLSELMTGESGFLAKWVGGKGTIKEKGEVFEVFSVMAGSRSDVNYTDVPALLRAHWTKVFLDDTNNTGLQGGNAYTSYGISKDVGAIVIVRPDGYIGITALMTEEGVKEVNVYFDGIMKVYD